MKLPALLYWEKLARGSHPGVLYKKGFLKFSQNSQKNTGVGVSFLIRLNAWGQHLYQKERLHHRYFPINLVRFFKTSFFIGHLRWLLLISKIIHSLKNERIFCDTWFCYLTRILWQVFIFSKPNSSENHRII